MRLSFTIETEIAPDLSARAILSDERGMINLVLQKRGPKGGLGPEISLTIEQLSRLGLFVERARSFVPQAVE